MNDVKRAVDTLVSLVGIQRQMSVINIETNIYSFLFPREGIKALGFRNAFARLERIAKGLRSNDVFMLYNKEDTAYVFTLNDHQYWLCVVSNNGGVNVKTILVSKDGEILEVVNRFATELYADPYFQAIKNRYNLEIENPVVVSATDVTHRLQQLLQVAYPETFDAGHLAMVDVEKFLSESKWLYERLTNLRRSVVKGNDIPILQIVIEDCFFIFHYRGKGVIPFMYWNPRNPGIVEGGMVVDGGYVVNCFKEGSGDALLDNPIVKEMFEVVNNAINTPPTQPMKEEMKISDFETTVKEFTTYLCDYLEEKGADFILNTTTDLERLLVEVTVSQMVDSMSERLVKNIFALSGTVHARELTPTQFNALRDLRLTFQSKNVIIRDLKWLEHHYKWLKKELQ